jgi:hypothetical protein
MDLSGGRHGHRTSHPFILISRGYIKNRVCVPPLLQFLRELRDRIHDAGMSVDEDMLRRVWEDVAFKWEVCRITRGSHIVHP